MREVKITAEMVSKIIERAVEGKITAERRLWIAAVSQVAFDLGYEPSRSSKTNPTKQALKQKARKEALKRSVKLYMYSKDFDQVCEFAGVEASYARSILLKIGKIALVTDGEMEAAA